MAFTNRQNLFCIWWTQEKYDITPELLVESIVNSQIHYVTINSKYYDVHSHIANLLVKAGFVPCGDRNAAGFIVGNFYLPKK